MEWAPLVIKEIISAFRQQHSLQDNEKLKNIVRDVMTENVSREQNKLLSEILRMLNKDSVQSSSEVEKTAMERDQLKKECERLTMEMERLAMQSRHKQKKEECINELSVRQKMLLQKVNELKKANAGKGRSRSRHRTAAGDGKPATNQSYQQHPGQQHSRGAISKYKHHHPAYKGNKNANTTFSGNSNNDSRAYYGSQYHPGSFMSGQNTCGHQGQGTSMAPSTNVLGMGAPQQQMQYQGVGAGPQQHTPDYQYTNRQGFSHYPQNPQLYQQNSQMNQPYNAGQPYKNGTQMSETYQQQQQAQFESSEAISQQAGQHQQFHHRGQLQRGHFHHRGQFQQRGHFQHRGQFNRGFNQPRDNFRPKDRRELKDDNPFMNQFTPEELNVLKEMLKQKKQQGYQEENKDGQLNSQMKTGFKNKQKKKKQWSKPKRDADSKLPSNEVSDKNDSDDSDTEDDLDELKKQFQAAFKDMGNQENKSVQSAQVDTAAKKPEAEITDSNTANENKEEASKKSSNAFDLRRAPLDISKLQEGPQLDAMLSSMVLVAKTDGQTVTLQPKTFSEMVEFKGKYPNAEVIVLQ